MNTGVVIFAHNNRKIDYSQMAVIAAGLARKHLGVPVSLITDQSTVEYMQQIDTYDLAQRIFDKIIVTDRPKTDNFRTLNDGNSMESVPFVNANRYSVYDLTPYDRTLLIDSDFLIFSDRLVPFLRCDRELMISESIIDLGGDRIGPLDKFVSDTGPNLFWATNVIFTKNPRTKLFFDLVDYIKENYSYFADLYRFYPKPYRNDISFSVAKHILDGHSTDFITALPGILSTIDKDVLIDINKNKLIFLIDQGGNDEYVAVSSADQDLHIMNKQSIIRHKDKLFDLI